MASKQAGQASGSAASSPVAAAPRSSPGPCAFSAPSARAPAALCFRRLLPALLASSPGRQSGTGRAPRAPQIPCPAPGHTFRCQRCPHMSASTPGLSAEGAGAWVCLNGARIMQAAARHIPRPWWRRRAAAGMEVVFGVMVLHCRAAGLVVWAKGAVGLIATLSSGGRRHSPSARSNMHSYCISNCSGLVTLEGLSSTLTLVTEIAVIAEQPAVAGWRLAAVGCWSLKRAQSGSGTG